MRSDLDRVRALRGAIGGVARNAFSMTVVTCMRRTMRSSASSVMVSFASSSIRRTLRRGAGRQSLMLCRQRGHERRECSHIRKRHGKQTLWSHGMVHHTARSNSSRHMGHSLILPCSVRKDHSTYSYHGSPKSGSSRRVRHLSPRLANVSAYRQRSSSSGLMSLHA